MSDQQSKPRPQLGNPFAGNFESFRPPAVQSQGGLPISSGGWSPPIGSKTDEAMSAFITAQNVRKPRDLAKILAMTRALAFEAGEDYYYSWEVKKKDGTKELVEGPTINLAMDLLRIYGNCFAGAKITAETPTHWIFSARFLDLEEGVTLERDFQQRKSQDMGMRDAGRMADMVFQAAQSKAIRNVVVAALKTFANRMVEAAKSGIATRVADNPDGARQYLINAFGDLGVKLPLVERQIGRVATRWTVQDMARLYGHLNSIRDGFINAADVFPDPEKIDPETGEVIQPKTIEGEAKRKPAAAPKQQAAPAKKGEPPPAKQLKEEEGDDRVAAQNAGAAAPKDGGTASGGDPAAVPADDAGGKAGASSGSDQAASLSAAGGEGAADGRNREADGGIRDRESTREGDSSASEAAAAADDDLYGGLKFD